MSSWIKKIFKNLLNKFKKGLFHKIKLLGLQMIGKQYTRHGQCRGCGNCCKNISVKHGKKVIKSLEQFEALQRKFPIYRMFKVIDQAKTGLIFQCIYLNEKTGRCIDYENRPPICRNYPNEIIFKLGGSLSDQCGFYFKPIKSFKSVLDKAEQKILTK